MRPDRVVYDPPFWMGTCTGKSGVGLGASGVGEGGLVVVVGLGVGGVCMMCGACGVCVSCLPQEESWHPANQRRAREEVVEALPQGGCGDGFSCRSCHWPG